MHRLDEGGNQLRRAIAYDDMGGVCAGIGADCLLECLIFFIGIGADEVQIFLQRVLCPFGKAKRVDIAAEINDFFLGDLWMASRSPPCACVNTVMIVLPSFKNQCFYLSEKLVHFL